MFSMTLKVTGLDAMVACNAIHAEFLSRLRLIYSSQLLQVFQGDSIYIRPYQNSLTIGEWVTANLYPCNEHTQYFDLSRDDIIEQNR